MEPVRTGQNRLELVKPDGFGLVPYRTRRFKTETVKTGLNFEQMVPAVKPPNWSKPAGSSPFQLLLLTLSYTAIRIMM